jgi:hypothetical protein
MLAASLLASLLAQAEPAPPESAPLPPALLAEPVLPRANAVSVHASLAYRVGVGGDNLGPAGGFSISGGFERRYFVVAGVLQLGAAIDFSYQRFSTGVEGSAMTGTGEEVFDGQRTLSKTGFALIQTVAVQLGRVRPFIGLGPGLAINFFSSPEVTLRPGSKTAVQPMAQAMAGFDVDMGGNTAIVVRADVTHPFTDPVFTPSLSPQNPPPRYALFGDVVDVGFGLLVRF